MKKPITLQKPILLLLLCGLHSKGFSQYWQQKVDYTIDVSLNDHEKMLDAFEKMVYTNNSPDTLGFIWFHLWPNAYKNDKTAFSDQRLELGNTDFYFSNKERRGYINRLDFKVDGITCKTEDHPQHIDIIKLILPKPLPPGQQVTITTPFHEKLPYNFSRGGYDGESFQLTQWYPKPAVYDRNGWHPMPYLEQGEYYSEFGSFDVRITVPKNYAVAATGVLQNEDERDWLSQRSHFEWQPEKQKQKSRNGMIKTITHKFPPSSGETKTLQFKQDSVHDFAWFADKRFVVKTDTCRLPSGRVVSVYSFYTPQEAATWSNSLQYAKDALRFYSTEVGEYPYQVATVVQGPQSFGGGMEYPTITVISPVSSTKELDDVITHEVGHNWFYGVLASNERDHPWMDEGINTFYEYKYMHSKYGMNRMHELLFQTTAERKIDQPIETTSEQFSETNYDAVAYHKTADWLQLLEHELGETRFRNQMHLYFEEWKFKHPQPADFEKIFEPALGDKTTKYFSYLKTVGVVPGNELKGFRVVSPLKPGTIKEYLKAPSKNVLLLSPAIGVNAYDRLMVGALISNYKLPPDRFQYLAVPLYGTGSKNFTGIGKLSYTIPSYGTIRKTDFFVNASRFSMNEFEDSSGKKYFTMFNKLVPGVRLTFREKDPRSSIRKYIQWKTFAIREDNFRFGTDTTFSGRDTILKQKVSLVKNNYQVNQLQFVYQNTRGLYPFTYQLNIEQINEMIKPTLTVNYLFNYPKSEGLNVRLFAGKIFFTKGRTESKSFKYDRYALGMTAPNGYEDYTYSNFFLGRNKFEGAASQQIAMRDGGFKFRTDLLSPEVGKTDNWLVALNLSSSISDKINPLSILPVTVPLKVYADLGTYAEAWDRNSTEDRFLFDAGLQLSVLKNFLDIYIPVVHSKVFKDYYKSYLSKPRFWRSISFTLNFYNKPVSDLNNLLEF
ncbi:MAG: M1 family metallopeptidase [Flavisolibacter sp.]